MYNNFRDTGNRSSSSSNSTRHPVTTKAAAAAVTAPIMADLPQEVVQGHRQAITNAILAYTALYPGYEWYALVCPCNIDCGHMPPEEIPRIMLSGCYYPGEFDYFFVEQPFFETHKFKVRWHCDVSHNELC